MNRFTISQFRNQFPTEDACLDYLFKQKFGELTGCPDCAVESKFSRVKSRRSYQCPICSYQIYPTAGTIFHKSTTPLTYWFYAIYLFTATRNGVAAKELERQLGVCYKTALRMAHHIKILMSDPDNSLFKGEVMADETYIGMKPKNQHKDKKYGIVLNPKPKTGILGIMEKDGRVFTQIIEHDKPFHSIPNTVKKIVDKNAVLVTDAAGHYGLMEEHFKKHVVINHMLNQYAKDGFSTNKIENYWSTLKRMIKGTHIHVSRKHLPKYLAENAFRFVHRNEPEKMFHKLLNRV